MTAGIAHVRCVIDYLISWQEPTEVVAAILGKLSTKVEQERNELDALISTTEGVTTNAKEKLVAKIMSWKYGL